MTGIKCMRILLMAQNVKIVDTKYIIQSTDILNKIDVIISESYSASCTIMVRVLSIIRD